MSTKLTKEEYDFLLAIDLAEQRGHRPATRGTLGCVTTRAQDRARQSVRRRGLAACEGTAHGWTREGWVLKPAGRQALSTKGTERQ